MSWKLGSSKSESHISKLIVNSTKHPLIDDRIEREQRKWSHLSLRYSHTFPPYNPKATQCNRWHQQLQVGYADDPNLLRYVTYPIQDPGSFAHPRFLSTGRGLSLAPGVQVPDVIQKALDTAPPARKSTSNRESMQRKRFWWLPYVVLEFDKNEVLIDALGGDLANPVWNYRADL